MQIVRRVVMARIAVACAVVTTAVAAATLGAGCAAAQSRAQEACPRPAVGATVGEPEDIRSRDGVLRVDVAYRNEIDANGHMRYCYVFGAGSQSANLRIHAGDLLILELKNELSVSTQATPMAAHAGAAEDP